MAFQAIGLILQASYSLSTSILIISARVMIPTRTLPLTTGTRARFCYTISRVTCPISHSASTQTTGSVMTYIFCLHQRLLSDEAV